jgi:hypothetical protein
VLKLKVDRPNNFGNDAKGRSSNGRRKKGRMTQMCRKPQLRPKISKITKKGSNSFKKS